MSRPLEIDLTGQRMGRLTVMSRAPNRGGKVCWLCHCDCGNFRVCQTFDLLFKLHSCGCYRRERQRQIHSGTFPTTILKDHGSK